MIYSTRHLRRGVLACLRAGWSLREISHASGIPRNHLQRVLDGQVTWATEVAARSLLEALPPAVQRAVEQPTYASGVVTQAGAVPVGLLLPILEEEIERYGRRNAAHMAGLADRQVSSFRREYRSISFALADRLLTATGNAMLWHLDPGLRRAYHGYACPERVLHPGTRRRVPARQMVAAA